MKIYFNNDDISDEITENVTSRNIKAAHLRVRVLDIARTALFLHPTTEIFFVAEGFEVVEITDQIREINMQNAG